MLQFDEALPLSLYIHFPWCVQKCPYCDFNSHELKNSAPEQQYVEALLRDLDQELPAIWGRPIRSIFMGGGTPSLFSAGAIEQLMSGLRARLNFSPDIEITQESNPGTADYENYEGYFQSGINRLSIGVQSFDDQQLKNLGRIHDAQNARNAFDMARKAGFKNINIDIMYGLPGQTNSAAIQDLHSAFDLGPQHVSWYQLTLEPNTWFYHHPPELPDDDHLFDIEQQGQSLLREQGFERYEISAYAKPDRQSLHNMNYWQFGDYIGIGAGAHSKRTDVAQQRIVRFSKSRNPKDYLAILEGNEVKQSESELDRQQVYFEFMLNALRLVGGFKKETFQARCGSPLSVMRTELDSAVSDGLLDVTLDTVRPSKKGLLYLNELQARFLEQ